LGTFRPEKSLKIFIPSNLFHFQIIAPFKPKISGDYDVDNFDTEFTKEGNFYFFSPKIILL